MAVLKGNVFEKGSSELVGCRGDLRFRWAIAKARFFATGVSLITHMANPHMPTAHFNIRFIETRCLVWGGYDLTPMGFPYDEDTVHFHQTAQQALTPFGPDIYSIFSQNARDYFYIPHRQKKEG